MAKVQCSYCKVKYPREELKQISKSRRICEACSKKKVQDANEYKNLIKYICDGFKLQKPTGQQLKSIKEFKDMGYTYFEIQYTLYYIFFVVGKKACGTSIGLVPFYYEKAMEHKRLYENAKKTAKKIATEEMVIVSRNSSKPKLNKTRYINIEEL